MAAPSFKTDSVLIDHVGLIESDGSNLLLSDDVLGSKTLSQIFLGPASPPGTSWKAPNASDPPTVSSSLGDIYYNTIQNKVRYFNGTAWADVNSAGLLKNPDTSDPSGQLTGTMYFNTTSGFLRIFDGTVWGNVGSAIRAEQNFDISSGDETNGYVTLTSSLVAATAKFDVYLNGLKIKSTDFSINFGNNRLSLQNGETLNAGDDLSVTIFS